MISEQKKIPTKKWLKMAEVYKYFANDWQDCCDFSNKAAQDMYLAESFGPSLQYNKKMYCDKFNGYAVGKHWMDATLAMWEEDISKGYLIKYELLEDCCLPQWFIRKLLDKKIQGKNVLLR